MAVPWVFCAFPEKSHAQFSPITPTLTPQLLVTSNYDVRRPVSDVSAIHTYRYAVL